MPHGDTVTDADGGDEDRGAARHAHTGLDGVGNLVEVGVAGDDLTVGGNNADQRAVQLLRGVAQRIEQAAVRCPLGAFFGIIAVHKVFSVFK